MQTLIENVESDPNREQHEKETGVNFLGGDEGCTVFSAKKTIVKSLLEHDSFEPSWFEIATESGTKTVTTEEEAAESDGIYGVSGEMPIGCLTIKSAPRANNHQSSVVNSETIDPDAFE
jgi:hypothetical protein